MREEEAKTKWCPHVRIDGCEEVQNSYNRYSAPGGYLIPDQSKCIASDCALWVWDKPPILDGEPMSNPVGHCGLIK